MAKSTWSDLQIFGEEEKEKINSHLEVEDDAMEEINNSLGCDVFSDYLKSEGRK